MGYSRLNDTVMHIARESIAKPLAPSSVLCQYSALLYGLLRAWQHSVESSFREVLSRWPSFRMKFLNLFVWIDRILSLTGTNLPVTPRPFLQMDTCSRSLDVRQVPLFSSPP